MTDTAPPEQPATDTPGGGDRAFVRVAFPAPAPVSSAPARTLPAVALVTLDRPAALNALSFDLLDQLATALEALDADPACGAIVITGSGDRAFAAGADIRELAPQTSASLTTGGRFATWDRVGAIGLPLIAAVRGIALGGGCELAMACDMIVAAEDATFGQPEIRLGVMPGAGGTQRLTRAIGKARAMELILTGRTMSAAEAAAAWPRHARRPHRGDPGRRARARGTDRLDAAAGRAGREGRGPRRIRAEPPRRPGPRTRRVLSIVRYRRTRPRGWPPSCRNARPSGRDADPNAHGGGRDGARPAGRERYRSRSRARLRRRAGPGDPRHDRRTSSRRSIPGARQRPLVGSRVPQLSPADSPEQDWTIARGLLYPAFRPVGTSGLAMESIDRETLAAHAERSHAQPLLDQGPAGLPVVYTIDAGAYDIVVNGDHLLSWGVEPSQIQDAALRNLAAWSATAPWTDEVSGDRRLISSDTGTRLGRRADPAAGGHRASRRASSARLVAS